MDYIIVPTSNSDYQSWQCRLLNWSRKKVKQSGKLILLRCEDEMGDNRPLDIYNDSDVEVIDLPNYSLHWENSEPESKRGEKYWWGAIPNKYLSIKWLCDNNYFNDDDNLLFLDPDMIFTEAIDYKPDDDEIVAQRFIHYYPLSNWTTSHEQSSLGIMYPFCINFKTLKKIIDDYKDSSEGIKRETKRWESEMWGLDHAVKKNNLKINFVEDFGFCTAWREKGDTQLSKLIHFPNPIHSDNGYELFFKQNYTFNPNINIEISRAKNVIDRELLLNVTQERTDFLYYLKWDFKNLFKSYTGTNGYAILHPWPGGFNNIRMSLELGVCIAYLTDKTLVLPPKYHMYLLQEEFGLEDFFDVSDLGIKTISFEDFAKEKNIEASLEAAKSISKIFSEPPSKILNFSESLPNEKFTKHREIFDMKEFFQDSECVYLDKSLLGNFYQTIYTEFDIELKQLISKHVHYKTNLMDLGWHAIQSLGDRNYYAIHIRRNDFQYKHLFITAEEIYNNIKNIIPEGSKLYIATDHKDKDFFNIFKEHYTVLFYEDIAAQSGITPHYNYIPILEQLVCSRAISFIGNDYSTLSSYVYRLRGYMDDILDKNFYVNTSEYQESHQLPYMEHINYIGNWAREFKDVWDLTPKKIFVSIASYCDKQLIPTLENLYSKAKDSSRLTVGVHIQDDKETYDELLNKNFPNIKIIFTPKEESLGVVWAREKIKKELITNEDLFLQIDAHSRFKNDWDSILVNQYRSMPHSRVVISTYPNAFNLTDDEYLAINTNAPLIIKDFFSEEENDNRLRTRNLGALKKHEVVETKWIGAGFIFAPIEWIKEIEVPTTIICKGEEDFQAFASYLYGWDILLPAEAVIWHNYNVYNPDKTVYREINYNNLQKDCSIEVINNLLFNESHSYKRTVKQLEEYLSINFKQPLS